MAELAGGKTIHVTPNNDLHPHIDSITCPCGPTADGWVVVHNSWDGREWREEEIALPLVDFGEWKARA